MFPRSARAQRTREELHPSARPMRGLVGFFRTFLAFVAFIAGCTFMAFIACMATFMATGFDDDSSLPDSSASAAACSLRSFFFAFLSFFSSSPCFSVASVAASSIYGRIVTSSSLRYSKTTSVCYTSGWRSLAFSFSFTILEKRASF